MGRPTFTPRSLTLDGVVHTAAPVDVVFPLFSPEGERSWVPGWDPELLHPAGEAWAQGQIFRTKGDDGAEVVWVVTLLDHEGHRARYHRVEPGLHVSHIQVRSRAVGSTATETAVSYTWVGLSDRGNEAIDGMTRAAHDARMARWTDWIDTWLERRGR